MDEEMGRKKRKEKKNEERNFYLFPSFVLLEAKEERERVVCEKC